LPSTIEIASTGHTGTHDSQPTQSSATTLTMFHSSKKK
jgi:hypothetical protein